MREEGECRQVCTCDDSKSCLMSSLNWNLMLAETPDSGNWDPALPDLNLTLCFPLQPAYFTLLSLPTPLCADVIVASLHLSVCPVLDLPAEEERVSTKACRSQRWTLRPASSFDLSAVQTEIGSLSLSPPHPRSASARASETLSDAISGFVQRQKAREDTFFATGNLPGTWFSGCFDIFSLEMEGKARSCHADLFVRLSPKCLSPPFLPPSFQVA